MLGRIPGSTCLHRFKDHLASGPPLRNPGPLGRNDAADPNQSSPLGDTPGPVGHNDYREELVDDTPRWIANRKLVASPEREKVNVEELKATIIEAADEYRRAEKAKLVLKKQATPAGLGRDGSLFKDSRGHSIVGIGFDLDRLDARSRLDQVGLDYHRLKAGVQVLSEPQMYELLDSEVRRAVRDAEDLLKEFDELPEEKKRAVVYLIYELGPDRFRKTFKKMIHALEQRDWNQSAEELRLSPWFDQAGDRGRELRQLLLGKPPVSPLADKRVRKLKRQAGVHAGAVLSKPHGGPAAQFRDGQV